MKFPFDFSLSLIFRLVFPGVVLATATLPLALALLRFFGIPGVSAALVLPILAVIIGWLIILADQPIYMLMEGRQFWPAWLLSTFTKWEAWRLRKIKERNQSLKDVGNPDKAREINLQKLDFPVDKDGDYYAPYPTRFGNLLTAYETHATTTYHLDTIFYWPRVWLLLDNESRKTMDDAQAIADGAVYVTFSLYCSAIVFWLYAIGGWIWPHWPLAKLPLPFIPGPWQTLRLGFIPLLLGYGVYRLGMYSQRAYGDLYRAMFDQNIGKLDPFVNETLARIKALGGDEAEFALAKYRVVSRFHRWRRIRLKGDTKTTPLKDISAAQGGDGEA